MVVAPVVIHPGAIVLRSGPGQLDTAGVGVQGELITNSSKIRTLIRLGSNYPPPEVS